MEMQRLDNKGKRVRDSNDVIPDHDLEEKQQTAATDGTHKCLNAKFYFCDFCDNTSIHGWKFFGERERYIIEKLWWFTVIVLAMSGSIALIIQNYKKWTSAPVIVTFATTEKPIWTIPFPAVTICPGTKNNITAFNITDVRSKTDLNETEKTLLDFFATVCPKEIKKYPDVIKTVGLYTYFEFILGYLYNPSLDVCKWMGKEENCHEMFVKKLTSEGVCYTFNMLKASNLYQVTLDIINLDSMDENVTEPEIEHWTVENGYEKGAGLRTYPRRTFLSSTTGGLFLQQCINKKDMDYSCSALQGYKVVLHHPAEEPNMDNHFWVPLNQVVMTSVKPKVMVTSKEIQAYSTEKRGCFLEGEKALSIYNNYTQKNCMMECLHNYTVAYCKCIPFYDVDISWHVMNISDDGKNIAICAGGKQKCVEHAKVQFMLKEAELKTESSKTHTGYCNCLPSCTSLEFDTELSQIDWNWKKSLATVGEEDLEQDCMQLYVYYKDMHFMASERHELYGTVEFLANCGGLLGLFCGFSCTSLIEILYYLTLRLICNFKRFGRRFWSGVKEE